MTERPSSYWETEIMEDYKFLFKVVLVGNAGVGKTCLVRRFTQGMFPPGQGATIGVDFMIKTVEIEGEKIKVIFLFWKINSLCIHDFWCLFQLQIWDTAGQERFRSITQSYYRSAHALILVYDVSNQPTFDCCPEWLREIEEYASPKVLKVLVGKFKFISWIQWMFALENWRLDELKTFNNLESTCMASSFPVFFVQFPKEGRGRFCPLFTLPVNLTIAYNFVHLLVHTFLKDGSIRFLFNPWAALFL